MRLLFIITSFWAYGEFQIAVDFAMKVADLGHEVMFLIPKSHVDKMKGLNIKYRVLILKGAAINRIILRDIEDTFKPSCVVLSDFLNYAFCEKHYGLTTDDLCVFSGLIGAFDLYNFTLAGKRIDTYGFRSKEISRLSVDGYDFLLQPSPVVQPTLSDKENHFRYRIFDGIATISLNDIKNAREKIGIDPSEKLIIMTGAVWQSSFRPYDDVKSMVALVDDVIMRMVSRLPKNYTVFWVGARHSAFPEGLTKIRHVDSMSTAEFDTMISCCDAFISTNHISTSMIRAALRGVPVVTLGNSYLKRQGKFRALTGGVEPDILNNIDTIYPFRMFPVGWYFFLEPVVKANPFYDLVKYVEVFDIDMVLAAVEESANQSLDQRLAKLDNYKKECTKLLDIDSIMTAINKKFSEAKK